MLKAKDKTKIPRHNCCYYCRLKKLHCDYGWISFPRLFTRHDASGSKEWIKLLKEVDDDKFLPTDRPTDSSALCTLLSLVDENMFD